MNAKSLRESKSQTIGLIVPDISNDFFATLALHIENYSAKHNYSVFICNSANNVQKEKDYFKVCIFGGNYFDIKIIDKNKTAAKYWYQKFLKLTRKRTSSDNTVDVINLITNDKFYKEDICKKR